MAEIGRISIKVTPDTDGFRRAVERKLEQLRSVRGEVRVGVDLGGDGVLGEFRVLMARLQAQASQGVRVGVYVDRNALADAGKAIGGLGGSGGGFGGAGSLGSSLGMMAVAAAAVAAVGPAIALLSGSLVALPGLLAGVGIPALMVAGNMDALKESFASVAPAFQSMSDSFVSGFNFPELLTGALGGNTIQDQLSGLFEQLKMPMAQLGSSMNAAFSAIIDGLTSGGGLEALKSLIGNIGDGFVAASPGIASMVEGLLRLANVVTGKGMVEAFNKMADSFLRFTMDPANLQLMESALSNLLTVITEFGAGAFDLIVQGLQQMAKPEFAENMRQLVSGLFSLVQAAAGFGNWLTSISGVVSVVGAAFGVLGGVLSGNLTPAFDLVRGAVGGVVAALTRVASTVVSTFQSAVSAVSGAASAIVGVISSAFSGLVGIVSAAWSAVVGAVQAGIDTVLSVVSALPGQITSALGDLGSLLLESGKSLMRGFAEGIRAGVDWAVGAARDALGAVRALFPFSPAKEGPFSGQGWVFYSGQSISEGLAEGITSSEAQAVDAAKSLVSGVGKALESGMAGFPDVGEGLQEANDKYRQLGLDVAKVPFDFAMASGGQFLTDIGVGGNGALSQLAKAGVDYGSQFIFNVSNIDEAMAVKNNQVNKQAAQYTGR